MSQTADPAWRASRARIVIAAVFGFDMLITAAFALQFLVERDLEGVVWALALLALFAAPVVMTLSRPGVEGAQFARLAAWFIGTVPPAAMWFLTALAWSAAPTRKDWSVVLWLVLIGGLHLLVPAALDWVRSRRTFMRALLLKLGMVAALLAAVSVLLQL